MYKIKVDYLEHSGGTKFYETVKITRIDDGLSVLVKRYGSNANKVGGGQTLISTGSEAAIETSRLKILSEKKKITAKGEYKSVNLLDLPIHLYSDKTCAEADFHTMVGRHYMSADTKQIMNYFKNAFVAAAWTNPADMTKEPEAPVVRDASWGSW